MTLLLCFEGGCPLWLASFGINAKPEFIKTNTAEFIQNTLPAHEVQAPKQLGRFTEIAAVRTGNILVGQRNKNCNLKKMKHDDNVMFHCSHCEDR